jgi:hypothetical protein
MKVKLALAAAALTIPAWAADVSGEWKLKGEASGVVINVNCSFKQEGAELKGVCKGGDRPDRTVSGSIEDQKVRFEYSVDFAGRPMKLVYNGALQTSSSIKGTITAQGVQAGEFTATKE